MTDTPEQMRQTLPKYPEWAEGYEARTAGKFLNPPELVGDRRKAWWAGWQQRHDEINGFRNPQKGT